MPVATSTGRPTAIRNEPKRLPATLRTGRGIPVVAMFTSFWAVVLRRRDMEFPFWQAAARRARTVGPRRNTVALYRIRGNPVRPVFVRGSRSAGQQVSQFAGQLL
jgi:hypothetical protein